MSGINYKSPQTVRSDAILTTGYVAGTVIDTQGRYNQANFYFDYTKGSLTSLEWKVEFSPDNSAFYQEIFESISGGTATETLGEHTTTSDGDFKYALAIKDRYVRLSFKGTGTVTGSSLGVDVVLGQV